MPKVNIAIGGKWHFYDIVAAAQEVGYLNKFYTSIYVKGIKLINSRVGKKFNLSNRHSNDIPSDKVVSNFSTEALPKLLFKLGLINDGQALYNRCKLFDDWTSKVMGDCDIFHSQDGFCLKTAKEARKKGTKVVCDRGIVSVTYLKQLSEEYKKFGIKKTYADLSIEGRTKEEHQLADALFVPTQTVKTSLTEEGIDGDKIKIIPYGVDLSFFTKLPERTIGRDAFRVLFVGEISIRKGCHYLLEAWEKLKFTNAELIMVGHIEKGFENVTSKYGNIFLHIPYISQADLKGYYANSNCLILPSLAEGSARVIYEAMAFELPVIYTEMSGSVARNNIDGFQIATKSVSDICERLTWMYENRENARLMGINGRAWIKNYSKENYKQNIIKEYNRLLHPL